MTLLERLHAWWIGPSALREKSYEYSQMMGFEHKYAPIENDQVELSQLVVYLYTDLQSRLNIQALDRWQIFTAADDASFSTNFGALCQEVVGYEKRWFVGRLLQRWRDPEIETKQAIIDYIYTSALFVNLDQALKSAPNQNIVPQTMPNSTSKKWQKYCEEIVGMYKKISRRKIQETLKPAVEGTNQVIQPISRNELVLCHLENEYQKIRKELEEINVKSAKTRDYVERSQAWLNRLNQLGARYEGVVFTARYQEHLSQLTQLIEIKKETLFKNKIAVFLEEINMIKESTHSFIIGEFNKRIDSIKLKYFEKNQLVKLEQEFLQVLDEQIDQAKKQKFDDVAGCEEELLAYQNFLDELHKEYTVKVTELVKGTPDNLEKTDYSDYMKVGTRDLRLDICPSAPMPNKTNTNNENNANDIGVENIENINANQSDVTDFKDHCEKMQAKYRAAGNELTKIKDETAYQNHQLEKLKELTTHWRKGTLLFHPDKHNNDPTYTEYFRQWNILYENLFRSLKDQRCGEEFHNVTAKEEVCYTPVNTEMNYADSDIFNKYADDELWQGICQGIREIKVGLRKLDDGLAWLNRELAGINLRLDVLEAERDTERKLRLKYYEEEYLRSIQDTAIINNDNAIATSPSYAIINEAMVNNESNTQTNIDTFEQSTDSDSSVGEETKYKYDQDKNQNLVEETTAIKPVDLTATAVSLALHQ